MNEVENRRSSKMVEIENNRAGDADEMGVLINNLESYTKRKNKI